MSWGDHDSEEIRKRLSRPISVSVNDSSKVNDLSQLTELLKFSNSYEISIQFWPKQTSVFIEKDGVELQSWGGSFDFAIGEALKYLNRITKKVAKNQQI